MILAEQNAVWVLVLSLGWRKSDCWGKLTFPRVLLATLLMSGNSQKGFFRREAVAEQLKVKLNAAVYQTNELGGKKGGFT